MNAILEHILLSDPAADAASNPAAEPGLHDLSDACESDTSLCHEVRMVVALLTYIRDARITDEKEDFERVWAETFQKTRPDRKGRMVQVVMRPALRWVAAAAILASLVLFSYVSRQSLEPQMSVINAPLDRFRVHTLSDGSSIRLSPGSSLFYPAEYEYSESLDGHDYVLDGSAFFSVAPITEPLRIKTELATVTVLGTQFGIVETAQVSRIILMEGVVEFASNARPESPVVVTHDESSQVVGTDLPSDPTPVDITAALKWTDLILFRATPLSEISFSLASRFNVRIDVDPALIDLTFTNTFAPEQGILEMLHTIALALAVKLDANPETGMYRFSPAS